MGTHDSKHAFWTWFSAREAELRAESIPPALFADLERHLFSVATVGWEIGPGGGGKTFFAISPDPGDAGCVGAIRALLAAAPHLEHWEFQLYKPPRDWELVFSVRAPDGLREVDAKRWAFVLYAFADGSFDIVIKPDESSCDLDDATLHGAAEVIVAGELGEELFLTSIGGMEVVKEWDARQAVSARRFETGLLLEAIARCKAS